MAKQDEYMAMRDNGHSNEEIAAHFGVKVATVERALRKHPIIKEEKELDPEKDDFTFPDEPDEQPTIKDVPHEAEVLRPIQIKCRDCGDTFTMSPAEQKFYKSKGFVMPKYCKRCRTNRGPTQEVTCVDCGTTFKISPTEAAFFEKHGLQAPKRCHECRRFKRERNKELEEHGIPT